MLRRELFVFITVNLAKSNPTKEVFMRSTGKSRRSVISLLILSALVLFAMAAPVWARASYFFRNPFFRRVPSGNMTTTCPSRHRPIAKAPDCLWAIKEGAWYGFPDFAGGEPVYVETISDAQ